MLRVDLAIVRESGVGKTTAPPLVEACILNLQELFGVWQVDQTVPCLHAVQAGQYGTQTRLVNLDLELI